MAGIVETVQRMGTAVVVVLVALPAVDFLLRGEVVVGGGLLAIAVIVVLVSEYVVSPTDVPASAAERTAGRIAKDLDDEE